ncbi:PTS beta-glucoside transporter subunit EIIBCA [Lactobacillus acidophilus]|uniref:PTS beta-glucoside transporter subunit IIBCA n=1 Tax=Lactobacillus acidophilus TaxID=1579 RepID=UPI000F75F00A|nr:PTS transporter subunit IIBCA [Lactobacillus acidophilus]AZN76175.1 PTS beta-glucoside transporter subunit EIIBCA [Lactobacillus acidophilus]
MDDKTLAKNIYDLVGGADNIDSAMHCATRLRIMVKDKSKVKIKEIENLPKVKGSFFNAGQYQIILGTGLVDKVYDQFMPLLNGKTSSSDDTKKKLTFKQSIRVFGDVFVPIIPVLVATGLFMGLRGLLTQDAVLQLFGMTTKDVPTQLLQFTQILTDTAFSFLPALVCWSTFKIFGGTPVLGIVLGLMLVNPVLPNAYDVAQHKATALVFFNFLRVTGYQGSVLPAFFTGIVASKFEKWLKKVISDSVDLIFRPFLTLLFGLIAALFVLGPIFHGVEEWVLIAVSALLKMPFGIGGFLYGCFGQLLGILGIHHILNLLEINMLAQYHWDFLNPIGTCGNIAEAGVVLAVAIKTASSKMKQIAYPSAMSAALGITEPAVFGVSLRLIRPFVCSMIAGGIGGFFASIFQLKATGMGLTGIPGTLLYLNNQLPIYLLVNLIAFGCGFALTWFFGYTKSMDVELADTDEEIEDVRLTNEKVLSPVTGKAFELGKANDEVFSSLSLGDGIAFEPKEGKVYAPVTGTVTVAYPTKHAIGIKSDDGLEVLIHIGIDTVELKGKYFDSKIKQGMRVKAGDELVSFDIDKIKAAGYDPTVMMIITNTPDYKAILPEKYGEIKHGDVAISAKA